jgi:transcriptional regulator with XRE-family HTH domain
MNTLGERIRHIRGTETQETFAARIGVSKGSLGGYERNENSPSSDVILKICSGANISVEWLMTGAGPMKYEDGAGKPAAHGGITLYGEPTPPAPEGTKRTVIHNYVKRPTGAEWAESLAKIGACPRCVDLYERLVQAQGRENALLQERQERERALLKENEDLRKEIGDLRIDIAALETRLSLSAPASDVS